MTVPRIGTVHARCTSCEFPITADQPNIQSFDGRKAAHWPRCPQPKLSVPIDQLSDTTLAELVEKGVIVPGAARWPDEPDLVNHPPHYTGHPSGIECIDITRLCHFSLGNGIKYVWRWVPEKWAAFPGDVRYEASTYGRIRRAKGGMEDLRKARWYFRDTLANGCSHHPHHKAKALLLEASDEDTNADRGVLLYLIAHGQLDNVIHRIDYLVHNHS